ncbi:MAG: DUF4180 domain-containing protein [Oscillospiraceae bacterium]|nr:DUF4180 domain-containing protein [Oscillospiraceae bacterium]
MRIKIIEVGGMKIAACESDEAIIKDGQSALEFAVNIVYAHDCVNIAVNKAAIDEDFFKLSTGVAGEVVQKFVNFRCRIAIFGDFSGYTSKPLLDYMHECNRGRHLYFVEDEAKAIKKLGEG